jgi:DNA primase
MMGSETELRFLLLPKVEDPDSIIRKHGGDHYEKIVNEQSIPYSQFMLGFCRNHINLNSDEGRSRFFDRATGYLDRMPATPFKCRLSQRVSEISGIKISETLPISMSIVPNADVFDVAGTVSRIAAEQLGLPVDSIRIDITPPKLQPSKMPVIESFENIKPSEELRSRAVMISKALKLDMTVIQGHTLDSLYRSACQYTDETKNIAKSVITDFLSKSNLFETQCQQTVVHLRAMRDCISESIERNEVTPELASELGGWIKKLKDNSGIYRSIIDLSGDAGAKQAVYASCESITQICTEFSSDLKMSVSEKIETNTIVQEESIISR